MPPAKNAPFAIARQMPFTLAVIFINLVVFIICWRVAGTTEGPRWTAALLKMGAQFNPLTLGREWYRIFTHVFLNGSIFHLILNTYAFLYVGWTAETRVGTGKFAAVFLLCAVAAALTGLYWNLFTVNTGMSGAIAGLFGFLLMHHIFLTGRSMRPMIILLAHFVLVATINLLFPSQVHADFAGLYGGFIMGVIMGVFTFARGRRAIISRIKAEYVMAVFLMLMFAMMPGYQVRYFRFFQQMVAAEDTTRYLIRSKLTDDDMRSFIRNYHHWEDIERRLVSQKGLPADLAPDTFRLAQYIDLRKKENLLKKLVVQREAYVYLDSVERLQQVMRQYMDLDYALWSRIRPGLPLDSLLASRMVRFDYDSNGVATTSAHAEYYRVGIKDSLGRWDGPFREYDSRNRIKIKGEYQHGERDGVFLYYSEDGKCVKAGRYVDDREFGKWQTFHANGRLESEVFRNSNGHFVSAVWDGAGNALVVDGNGREIQLHPNGVIALSGEYRQGQKEGVWTGWYDNGEMHFEETFAQGQLLTGKSRNPGGETFVYDESSLFPRPEGGFASFQDYVKREVKRFRSSDFGHVKLSFRVTPHGVIADVQVDQGATPALDARAREILLNGPRWLPARHHGHTTVDAPAYVQVEFY